MGARIIDGVTLAKEYRQRIAERAAAIRERGTAVRLDALLVESGDNGARVYAENQARTCELLGIQYKLHVLAKDSIFDDIAGRVLLLSANDEVSAIMVHMPMPADVDAYQVQRLIAHEKDVEGVNPANIGNVVYGRSSLAPCTGLAVVRMIEHVCRQDPTFGHPDQPMLRGKLAVVVGAGDVVGKPIAVLLMRQEATVISCNKFTPGLSELMKSADVLVAAAGVPGLVKGDMVKPGAVVIDVGVNRVMGANGKLQTVGDVDFASVSEKAGWLSPVPGGVGPMTVAML
ncbi:MAG: bifunctional 5,10-methylenetetrahydrofolate dehydrogenase/5,10-methenyltetrahydrofolate cyclohydrolase, partial [bacterium]|nr:bifunctional 5,10-methylenetetrahydrofolate dehydrogenase/5,10-methenyltetrahydrofolate cyclohydrolase [bacterium]